MARPKKNSTPEVVEVKSHGDQITVPEGMSYDKAIEWLQRRKTEAERVIRIDERVNAFPFDAAHAFAKAMAQKYGWVDMVPTPGFWGDNPPSMIGVEVAPDKTVQVPWGRVQIPNVVGWVETHISIVDGNICVLRLVGETLQKHAKEFSDLANLTREILKTDSIYRGKAMRVKFPEPGEKPNVWNAPKFLDVSGVKPDELIFAEEVKAQISTSLFTPVEHTAICREHRIPLKRGILLEGPYGTGKTLTAYAAARKCEDNGWTFIYLDTVADLQQAIRFASQYQPAMIFAEDIDRVMEGDDRDHDMDAILNTIDGIDSKNTETIVVLTTNHVDNINQAMLRPGRLDAVVSVQPPDAKAVQQLVRMYGRTLLAPNEDLAEVGKQLQGQIPAVIREVVERAKLAAISRNGGGQKLEITSDDLKTAATGMLNHLRLLAPRADDNRTDMEAFAEVVGSALVQGVRIATQDFGRPALPAKGNSNGSYEHTA